METTIHSKTNSAPAKGHEGSFFASAQRLLTVNEPGDAFEQEANAMADTVMRMPEPGPVGPFFKGTSGIQRKCQHCEEEERKVRRKESGEAATPTPSPAVQQTLGSSGQSLDAGTRTFMEQRFGQDFSHVQIHNDGLANQSSADIQARAYTHSNHIVFGAGQYQPGTDAGKHLLAHELTHVVQQGGMSSSIARSFIQRDPDSKIERPPFTGPQSIDKSRDIELPKMMENGKEVIPHLSRVYLPCPCRKVSVPSTGFYYNSDIDRLAFAFKYCKGSTMVEAYIKTLTDLDSLTVGGIKTTVQAGVDIHAGDQARIKVRGVGTNKTEDTPAPQNNLSNGAFGVGGGVEIQLITVDGKYAVTVSADYLRLFNQPGNTSPNEIKVNPKVKIGPFEVGGEVTINGNQYRILGTIGNATQPEKVDCSTCYCPLLQPQYYCDDWPVPPKSEKPKVPEPQQFRIYFKLDKNEFIDGKEPTLVLENQKSFDAIDAQLKAGAKVTSVTGYASPEYTTDHNATLSTARANAIEAWLKGKFPDGYGTPAVRGSGELLGAQPGPPEISKDLTELVKSHHFTSPEEVTTQLKGATIPTPQLTQQFKSLFNALSEPEDRVNDKLALLGIRPDDPVKNEALAAIDSFRHSRDNAYRPWEHLFGRLRVGIVSLSPVPPPLSSLLYKPSPVDDVAKLNHFTPTPEVCKDRGKQAEAQHLFGDPAKEPERKADDVKQDCETPAEDTVVCKYKVPHLEPVPLAPPSYAPNIVGKQNQPTPP